MINNSGYVFPINVISNQFLTVLKKIASFYLINFTYN